MFECSYFNSSVQGESQYFRVITPKYLHSISLNVPAKNTCNICESYMKRETKGKKCEAIFCIPFSTDTLVSSRFRIFTNIAINISFSLDSSHPLVYINFIFYLNSLQRAYINIVSLKTTL